MKFSKTIDERYLWNHFSKLQRIFIIDIHELLIEKLENSNTIYSPNLFWKTQKILMTRINDTYTSHKDANGETVGNLLLLSSDQAPNGL